VLYFYGPAQFAIIGFYAVLMALRK